MGWPRVLLVSLFLLIAITDKIFDYTIPIPIPTPYLKTVDDGASELDKGPRGISVAAGHRLSHSMHPHREGLPAPPGQQESLMTALRYSSFASSPSQGARGPSLLLILMRPKLVHCFHASHFELLSVVSVSSHAWIQICSRSSYRMGDLAVRCWRWGVNDQPLLGWPKAALLAACSYSCCYWALT